MRRCAATAVYGLRIAGRRHGYSPLRSETAICDTINASDADVLWVGLGVPLEYEFCVRNRHRLNVGWIVTCGGCFNFVTGDYARAPHGCRRAGSNGFIVMCASRGGCSGAMQ